MQFYFYFLMKNMLKSFLGFGCMHENNFFFKVEIDLKDFFLKFF